MESHRSTSDQLVAAPTYRRQAHSNAIRLGDRLPVLATVGLAGVILMKVYRVVA